MLLRAKSRTGSRPRSLCIASRLQPSAILGWPPPDQDPLRAGGIAMTGRSGPFSAWVVAALPLNWLCNRPGRCREERFADIPPGDVFPQQCARAHALGASCLSSAWYGRQQHHTRARDVLPHQAFAQRKAVNTSKRTSISATSGHNCTSPNRTAAIGQLHENGSITGHTTTSQRNSCDTLGAQTHASASSRPPHSAHDMSLIPREVEPDRPAPTIPRRRHSGYATPASQTWSLSNIEA